MTRPDLSADEGIIYCDNCFQYFWKSELEAIEPSNDPMDYDCCPNCHVRSLIMEESGEEEYLGGGGPAYRPLNWVELWEGREGYYYDYD